MSERLLNLVFEIDLKPGEQFTLPEKLTASIGPGRWLLTIQPAASPEQPIRAHSSFLNSYAPEDEGLYDDD